MEESRIYIGTSGWNYGHWQGIFYPEDIKSHDLLSYYSRYFSTVEINSSFYHLPRETTFSNWRKKVPKDFLFSVKVWRRITHLKKLNKIEDDLKIFWQRCMILKEKLGPLLFQFPPSFQATKENIKRLENLSKFIRANLRLNPRQSAGRHSALEFRHQSWFDESIYKILKKYNLALCWADTPCYPYQEVVTTNYVYFRLHGHEQLYASKYTKTQLQDYAQKIKKCLKKGFDVFIYFDNDFAGHAVENAKTLKTLVG